MTLVLDHPKLGTIHGKRDGDVAQYLGLQYATLKDPFAQPAIISRYDATPTDATRHGPMVVTPMSHCAVEQSLIQHELPTQELQISDTRGLNLNITSPQNAQGPVPVLVFIHGGSFAFGSGSWPQYDMTRFVRHSLAAQKPIISVTINYRLGVHGFLTSTELQHAGYKANNGIRDQRVALEWVKMHIGGFGGDPENITVVGESAGAAAITLHLQSSTPLFQRAVVMSGSYLMVKSLPSFVAESVYAQTLEALNLNKLDPEERVELLTKLPGDELLAKTGGIFPLNPVVDNEIIFPPLSHAQTQLQDSSLLPGKHWLKSILLGDCKDDGSIFGFILSPRKQGIAKAFRRSVKETFKTNPQIADQIFREYNLQEDTPDDAGLLGVSEYITDIGFYMPLRSLAEGWTGGDAYVYHFNEPNPWEGASKGQASHILDVAFLLLNYVEFLPVEQRASAELFASHVISFTYGDAPFPAYSKEAKGAMVYDSPKSSPAAFQRGDDPESVGRRGAILRIAEQAGGLDGLSLALDNFMAGN